MSEWDGFTVRKTTSEDIHITHIEPDVAEILGRENALGITINFRNGTFVSYEKVTD